MAPFTTAADGIGQIRARAAMLADEERRLR
jgi:hypothetical protein